MPKYTIHIKRKGAEIYTCCCGIKFIEIQAELDMGYVREKCYWCVAMKHNGRHPPPVTHRYVPYSVYIENDRDLDIDMV